ncbi:MAG: SGNH/GDSL hydrolase family protein [Proteobacteria bacterium]|nr:SGNH/GDSL hydrolase family protein [Pseudomonadota bacterium]
MNDKAPGKSQNLFISLSIFISLTFSIIIAEWVLSYQRQSIDQKIKYSEQMDPGMILYDAQLGWKLKPYWSGKHHHYDYDVTYNINENGFRGSDVSVDAIEYAVVGDSFSFGLGVDDDETFTALLNTGKDQKKHYYNYSVPGYSTDQQLLLINKFKDEISKNVLLIVYLGNDIFDNMRDYPLQAEHGKPYFSLNNNKLQLENTPVPLVPKPAEARKDSISNIVLANDDSGNAFSDWLSQLEISRRLGMLYKKTVLTDSAMEPRFAEPLNLFITLVYEMEKLIKKNDGRLDVVLLPGRSYVEQPESLSAQYQEYFRKNIISLLDAAPSIKVMDMAVHLRELHHKGKRNLYYPNEGHLTPLGHRYVAEHLDKSF